MIQSGSLVGLGSGSGQERVQLSPQLNPAWRFMGSYKWGYKSPNKGYKYSYLTEHPTENNP